MFALVVAIVQENNFYTEHFTIDTGHIENKDPLRLEDIHWDEQYYEKNGANLGKKMESNYHPSPLHVTNLHNFETLEKIDEIQMLKNGVKKLKEQH